ncbi:Ppx/GppA phosphatase family protein [Nocardioides sp. WG-D5]|uniref:Ppx/GppA phosphatase family protein n=1 Tax=Nocardioides luteus TaxID=1844 RepID=UPI0018C91FA9|nr:Ppx/GppA phosphatase family protein [Nocardioides luteus]MBG6098140.1 exopolyphosphatase/guanosine-5'-triphosphate,3'-diphosphate pyrophosphatase [Nocardioides luteus]
MTQRVAAIDCGTNTIKLLIATVTADGLTEDVREARMVRLGQGVDRTGVLADEALERAFGAIDEYAAMIREHGVERVRFVATSATRDAANAATFTDGVRERLGVTPEVVTGAEEAALSFGGAARNLRGTPEPPVLVIDIGGGSTELILGDGPTMGVSAADSMDIGSVRLHERHLRSDPPTREEIEACVRDIDAHLDDCPVDPAAARTVVAVGGTMIQLTMGLLELAAYDRTATDHAEVSPDDVHRLVDRLLAMTVNERLALPWMHPGRADVIAAGGVILSRILRRTRVDSLLVSESDILDGIAWSVRD